MDLAISAGGPDNLAFALKTSKKLGYNCVAVETYIQQTIDPASLSVPKPPCPELDPRSTDEGLPCAVPKTMAGKLLQLSRATIEIDNKHITGGASKKDSKIYQLSSSNLPHFAAFNILSVAPTDSASLSYACLTLASNIEVIVLQPSDLPGGKSPLWGVKRSTIRAAVKSGCFFELRYSPLLSSRTPSIPNSRRNFASLLKSISSLTGGKGLIVSSAASSWESLRAPSDLINLLETMGLDHKRAQESVSENPRKAILRGFANRQTYRGVISAPILTTTIVTLGEPEAENETVKETTDGLIPTAMDEVENDVEKSNSVAENGVKMDQVTTETTKLVTPQKKGKRKRIELARYSAADNEGSSSKTKKRKQSG